MIRARLGLLAERDFAIYWSGGLLSNVGTWLQTVAAAVLMLNLTGSPLMVGLLGTCAFLPILLFTVFAGAASDRFDRRRIVVVTHLVAMVITAVLAAAALGGRLEPWMLLAVAFLTNAAYSFAKPALTSLLPAVVPRERLAEASAVNTLQFTLGQTIGSLIAAVILLVSTPGVAFAINALTYLGPVVAMFLISPRSTRVATVSSRASSGITAGFRFLWATPALLAAIVAVAASSSMLEATRTLSPVLVTDVLGADDSATGLMIAAASLGSAMAILAIPRLLAALPLGRVAAIGFVVQISGLLLQGFAPGLPAALAGACLVGVGFSFSFTQMTAMLQLGAPDELRGRVMSIHTLCHLGLRPFTALIVGSAATLAGGRAAILLFAVLAPIGLAAAARASRVDTSAPASAQTA
ncbi:MAG: MFS transporter [Chloroflexota bacterium]